MPSKARLLFLSPVAGNCPFVPILDLTENTGATFSFAAGFELFSKSTRIPFDILCPVVNRLNISSTVSIGLSKSKDSL